MDDSAKTSALPGAVLWSIWIALGLLAFWGFLHLGADFPNHSRWSDDAAKFTDEGWYASGALNYHLTGHWLRAGDFNPMITIPVWSVLLAAVFHFAGISIALARGLAFAFTLGTVLVAGKIFARDHRRFAPVLMLLLLANPLLYFFSRLAILESALIFFLALSALAVYNRDPLPAWRLVLGGTLLVLAMLTKSSAAFAAPGLVYLVCLENRRDRHQMIRAVVIPLVTFGVLYGLYWFLEMRTHPVDVGVLYKQNALYLGRESIRKILRTPYRSLVWIDVILYPVAVIAVIASLGRLRRLWLDPLFGFAIILYLGYCGFLVLHFDAGPRYFAVLVLPVMILVVLLLESLELANPVGFKVLAAVIALATLANLTYIVRHSAHPEYTLRDAGLAARSHLLEQPGSMPLAIGHGAAELSYFTQLPALDDMGSMPVAAKLAYYHPVWMLTYDNDCELMGEPGVASAYRFRRIAAYPVFDSPERDQLLLYRIEKKITDGETPGPPPPRLTPPAGQTAGHCPTP